MEPETIRPEIEEVFLNQKSYPIAPVSYLNHIQMINPKNVAKIGVSQIKKLSQRTFPNDVFPQIKDFADNQIQELTEKLLSINNAKFLEVLCTVIFMCSGEGIDVLERCGVNTNVEYQGEKVVLSYIDHTEVFEVALNYILSKAIVSGRTYHIFSSKEAILPHMEVQDVSTEDDFRKYFKQANCGNFCRLRLFSQLKNNDPFGFFIEHGTILTSKTGINTQDKLSFRNERNLMGDLAVYIPHLKLILVSSRSSRNSEFYAKMVGKIFWNNEKLFKKRPELDLSFIYKTNAKGILQSCCSGRIKEIQIKGLQIITNNVNNTRITLRKGKGCLTEDKDNYIDKGSVVEIELALQLLIDGKNKLQRLVLKPKSMKSGKLISPSEVQHIFAQLELSNNEKK